METFLKGIPNLRIRQKIRDDDSIDQLHHFVTVYMFVLFSVIIGIKELAGQPLDCWVTQEKWKHFQEHVNSYCWSNKLYSYPDLNNLSVVPYELTPAGAVDDPVVAKSKEADDEGLNIYRWVTVVFVCQAFLFKLPALIWSLCNEYSGTQIERMVSMLLDSTFKVPGERRALMGVLAEYLEIWLKISRKPYWFMKSSVGLQSRKILRYCMLCVGGNKGNFLSSMYLLVKVIFLFNVILQFVLLTAFLEFSFWSYGPKALEGFQTSRLNRDYFPVTGLCHFQMRGEGSWVQCILTINMLLEKIFLVEWFWLLILLIITAISLVVWIFRVLHTDRSIKFVERYLCILQDDGFLQQEGKKTVQTFVMNYLGNDGIFVLRILATNTNDVAMAELVSAVWERFVQYKNKNEMSSSQIELRRTMLSDDHGVELETTGLNEDDKDIV